MSSGVQSRGSCWFTGISEARKKEGKPFLFTVKVLASADRSWVLVTFLWLPEFINEPAADRSQGSWRVFSVGYLDPIQSFHPSLSCWTQTL